MVNSRPYSQKLDNSEIWKDNVAYLSGASVTEKKSFITLIQGVAAMGGVGEPEDHVSIKTGREPTPSKLLALPTNIRLGC
jgi:hypothetical protein